MTLTFTGQNGFDSQWGYITFYKFIDESGNIFSWKTSTYQDLEQGKAYQVAFTVKEHSEFKDVKTTDITRCKLL